MRHHALFIGIDDYDFAPLTASVNDAVSMRDCMMGFAQPPDCTLMTSPPHPDSVAEPTRKAILDFLLRFYDSAAPLDALTVFYAGHGLSARLGRAADRLATILVPAGVKQLKNSGDQMIDLDELVGRFRRRGAKNQYWIIDACRNELEGPPPKVGIIGWDDPVIGDPREAFEMAQSVLYAVAPLGQAQATRGGHGRVTSHLLDALNCRNEAEWGGGGWYDEGQDTFLFNLDSLADYARRRILPTLVGGDWQAQYFLPQCWNGEKKPDPLLTKAIVDRPFSVSVIPPEAAGAVSVALKVKKQQVASWPPNANGTAVKLLPERYRLDVRLAGAQQWSLPQLPNPPLIDVRDVGHLDIPLAPPPLDGIDAARSRGMAPPTPSPSVGVEFVPPILVRGGVVDHAKYIDTPEDAHYEVTSPVITVNAIDPGVTLHLTRLAGGKEERDERPGVPITLSEGLWRIEIKIGSDVIGVVEDYFADAQRYAISATAQVTPALAALMSDPAAEALQAVQSPHTALTPSETIGSMQGAILPTLLPLLALKPLDRNNAVLQGFSSRLGIPIFEQRTPSPLAVALAFDGPWVDDDVRERAALVSVRPGRADGDQDYVVWRDASSRISLLLIDDDLPRGDLLLVTVPGGWGEISVAVPKVPKYCTTAAITLWPDGRHDISVSLFMLPPGVDQLVRPGRLSRSLAIATRLYRSGRSTDDVDYDVFSLISSGSYGDPTLGAVAWFMRARKLRDDRELSPAERAKLQARQGAIAMFLRNAVPDFADGRVINALSAPNPDYALDRLLDDQAIGQPVLADALSTLARRAIVREQLDHWSVARFQLLAPEAVFNSVLSRTPSHRR